MDKKESMPIFSWLNRTKKERSIRMMTKSEVLKHNSLNDCWIILKNKVFDITEFINYHPGSKDLFSEYAGKDCTEMFYKIHSYVDFNELLKYEQVGYLIEEKK